MVAFEPPGRFDFGTRSTRADGARVFEAGGRSRTHALPPEATFWMLADEGRQYVGYTRGISETVTLSLAGGEGACRGRRFNPRTGAYEDLGTHRGGTLAFTPPDGQDWVVVVDAAGEG